MSQLLAHLMDENSRTKDVIIVENVTFESLLLSENILKSLTDSGFRKPSPIQLKSIPIGRCGFDLIVKSKSGTGKTLVFSIIALENIDISSSSLQVLILAPTREIAVQIQEVIRLVGSHIEGLKVECFIGGLPLNDDKEKCKACHIAVGSPGRIKHLINEGIMTTNSVRLFVLDEADKLMESSFRNDINEIYNNLPQKKQIITTSATYSKDLETFLSEYMCSPTHVTAELETPLLLGLKQFVVVVEPRSNVVQQMRIKTEELVKLFSTISFTQCIVFSNYQTRAESISNLLNQKGWQSTYISAAQPQSQRLEAVNNLKDFKCRIMLSTDLTARGIDAANVDLVVNYDIPLDATTYLHRMGRAGRYGSFGVCVNLASGGSELDLLKEILGQIGGSALSIPKLPSFTGNVTDLLKVDVSSQDHISGKIENVSKSDSKAWKNKKIYDFVKDKTTTGSIESEAQVDKNSEILGLLNETKNELEEVRKQISTMDAQSILASLASQNFDMDLSTNDSSEKESSNSSATRTVEEKAAVNILQTLLSSKATEPHSLDTPKEPNKDKSNSSSDEQRSNEIFTKNIALLNVTQILDGAVKGKSDDEEGNSIQQFLNILKREEKDEVSQLSKKSIPDILDSLQNVDTDTESHSHPHDNKVAFDIENIFKFGYDCIVKSDDTNWKRILEEIDNQASEERVDEEYISMDEEACESNGENDHNVEIMKWMPVEKTIRKQEKPVETCGGDNNEVDIMKWIPVEQSSTQTRVEQTCMSQSVEQDHLNYEQFNKYFNDCSEQLWQNGMNFDSVDSFDEWYHYEWEAQLYAVRNFVQQNVYVREMSKFQNRRSN